MSDNPFGDAGNAERPATAPGGWRSEAQMPIGGPAAPNWASDAQVLPKIGPSPLAAAAAPILAIIGRLANGGIAGEPQLEELRERAMRAFRAFEADARGANGIGEGERQAELIELQRAARGRRDLVAPNADEHRAQLQRRGVAHCETEREVADARQTIGADVRSTATRVTAGHAVRTREHGFGLTER